MMSSAKTNSSGSGTAEEAARETFPNPCPAPPPESFLRDERTRYAADLPRKPPPTDRHKTTAPQSTRTNKTTPSSTEKCDSIFLGSRTLSLSRSSGETLVVRSTKSPLSPSHHPCHPCHPLPSYDSFPSFPHSIFPTSSFHEQKNLLPAESAGDGISGRGM